MSSTPNTEINSKTWDRKGGISKGRYSGQQMKQPLGPFGLNLPWNSKAYRNGWFAFAAIVCVWAFVLLAAMWSPRLLTHNVVRSNKRHSAQLEMGAWYQLTRGLGIEWTTPMIGRNSEASIPPDQRRLIRLLKPLSGLLSDCGYLVLQDWRLLAWRDCGETAAHSSCCRALRTHSSRRSTLQIACRVQWSDQP